jgi:hypothetical protein
MKEIQGRLCTYLASIAPRFHSASASKDGLGSVRNARAHKGHDFLWKLDFADAFDSVNSVRLASLIAERARRYSSDKQNCPTSDEWYQFLSRYALTRKGGLIQGSRVSSLLFDWYCEVLVDKPIRKLIKSGEAVPIRHEFEAFLYTYTRYVDDLVISARYFHSFLPSPVTRAFRREVREIITRAGFKENPQKTVVANLKVHGAVLVTGVHVGSYSCLGLPRKVVKSYERMLDTAVNAPLFSTEAPESIDGKLRYFLDVLRGKQGINKLEMRTLLLYIQWCKQTGRDTRWAEKMLARQKQKQKKPLTEKQLRALQKRLCGM